MLEFGSLVAARSKGKVRLEGKEYAVHDGDVLEITVHTSRPLSREAELSVFLFGYRADTAFAGMPKLHLEIGALRDRCLDQETILDAKRAGIDVCRSTHQTTVRVPLRAMGDPQRILASTDTYVMEDVRLDSVSWRILDVSPPAK